MGKGKIKKGESLIKPPKKDIESRKATTPEGRENQLINLAVDLAEQQLRDGTATSQVITHYLKLGSSKERKEQELLEQQTELAKAKVENLKILKHTEELYEQVLAAMKEYSGSGDEEYYE